MHKKSPYRRAGRVFGFESIKAAGYIRNMQYISGMYTLRPYQAQALAKSVEWLENYKKPGVCVAPTGSGKSLLISELAGKYKEVLVFQPSIELLRQNYAKYCDYNDNGCVYSAGAKKKDIGECTFATLQSVIKNKEEFGRFKYLIIDECHLYPSFGSMFDNFRRGRDIKIIGLTATPFRLKTNSLGSQLSMLHGTSHIWGGYPSLTQIQEVHDYWCPIEYQDHQGNLSMLKVNSSGSDYTEESTIKYGLSVEDKIMAHVESYRGKSLLVFVSSIEQAARLADKVPASAYVCCDTPAKEREKLVREFKEGVIKVMFNVNIFSIGFDFPALDGIIDSQPTLSLARYYQRVGRICRSHESKSKATYTDIAGNFYRFGRVEDFVFKPNKVGYHLYSGESKLTGVNVDSLCVGNKSSLTMPFGKYKGHPLKDIPASYIFWLRENCDLRGPLRDAVYAK